MIYEQHYAEFLQDFALETMIFQYFIELVKDTDKEKNIDTVLKKFRGLMHFRNNVELSGNFRLVDKLRYHLKSIQFSMYKISGCYYIKCLRSMSTEIIKFHEIKQKFNNNSSYDFLENYAATIVKLINLRSYLEKKSFFSNLDYTEKYAFEFYEDTEIFNIETELINISLNRQDLDATENFEHRFINFSQEIASLTLYWEYLFKKDENLQEELKYMLDNFKEIRNKFELSGDFGLLDLDKLYREFYSKIKMKYSFHSYKEYLRKLANEIMKFHEYKVKVDWSHYTVKYWISNLNSMIFFRNKFEKTNLITGDFEASERYEGKVECEMLIGCENECAESRNNVIDYFYL